MKVLQRIKDMTKASVHDPLDRVEDPIVMLNQYLRDMEEEIAQAEVTVARQMANERKLRQHHEEIRRRNAELEVQTEAALSSGEEEKARRLLEEKIHVEQKEKEYEEMAQQASVHAEELKQRLHEMKHEFYQMRSKRNELVSRTQMANARKQMNSISNEPRLESGQAAKGFHRMEEKIMQLEAESELSVGAYPGPSAAANRSDLQDKVEARLDELKEKMH